MTNWGVIAMKTMFRSLFAVSACLSWTGEAHAELIYRYVFDRPVYTVAPGETVLVNTFLQETVTGGDTSRLATEGLIGAGVRVRFDIPPAPGSPAQVLNLSDILPNTADFDDAIFQFTDLAPGSLAELTEVVDLASPPVLGTELTPGIFRVFLGSFRFTAGSALGEVTTVSALDSPRTEDTITGTGLVLDGLIESGDSTIRVSAVPEPSALTLVGTGALGLIGYSWRRHRAGRGNLSRTVD